MLALFLMSHLFLVITHMPLMTDVCEFLFYLSDEKILDELCFQKVRSDSISHPETVSLCQSSRPSTDFKQANSSSPRLQDYLSEPKSLVNCLTSFAKASPKSSKKSKSSRSRSMPHFPSNNKSTTKSLGDFENTGAEEKEDETADDEAMDNNADEDDATKTGPANGLLVDLGSRESSSAATPTFGLEEKAILPVSDAGETSSANADLDNPRSNITDDEKSFRQSSSSAYSSMLAASSSSFKSSPNSQG